MRVVYKYGLKPIAEQAVALPIGAKVLHVADQNGTCCIWAEVDATAPRVERLVRVFGTGSPIFDDDHEQFQHIGTWFTGPYVFHVYLQNAPQYGRHS